MLIRWWPEYQALVWVWLRGAQSDSHDVKNTREKLKSVVEGLQIVPDLDGLHSLSLYTSKLLLLRCSAFSVQSLSVMTFEHCVHTMRSKKTRFQCENEGN